MRKSNWYKDGAFAHFNDQARDTNPYEGDPAYYVRRRAWFAGWDDEHAASLGRGTSMFAEPGAAGARNGDGPAGAHH